MPKKEMPEKEMPEKEMFDELQKIFNSEGPTPLALEKFHW